MISIATLAAPWVIIKRSGKTSYRKSYNVRWNDVRNAECKGWLPEHLQRAVASYEEAEIEPTIGDIVQSALDARRTPEQLLI